MFKEYTLISFSVDFTSFFTFESRSSISRINFMIMFSYLTPSKRYIHVARENWKNLTIMFIFNSDQCFKKINQSLDRD